MADDQALSDDATGDAVSISDQSVVDPGAEADSTAAPQRRSSRPVKRAVPLAAEIDEIVPEVPAESTGRIDAVRASRPVRRTTSGGSTGTDVAVAETSGKTTAKKGRATKSRDDIPDAERRVGPAEFTRQSVSELRKVVWPTGPQLARYFLVVLLFVLFIITYVGLLDVAFGWGLLKLLGK